MPFAKKKKRESLNGALGVSDATFEKIASHLAELTAKDGKIDEDLVEILNSYDEDNEILLAVYLYGAGCGILRTISKQDPLLSLILEMKKTE